MLSRLSSDSILAVGRDFNTPFFVERKFRGKSGRPRLIDRLGTAQICYPDYDVLGNDDCHLLIDTMARVIFGFSRRR
jgi:hypothetical protein